MAEDEPIREFGRRKPVAPSPASPPKRSGHVALLLMGTLAVGGGAYALMPDGCEPPLGGDGRAWRLAKYRRLLPTRIIRRLL